jgi:beta-glucanase (GH16 family)
MRVRCSVGYSKCLALLWPDGNVWPPEVDFYEIFASDNRRTTNKESLHYTVTGNHRMHWAEQHADYTQWHVVSVRWTPSKLEYLLDGKVVATMTQNVPAIAMHFAMQTSVSTSPTAPTPTGPVRMDIDWVQEYSYSG